MTMTKENPFATCLYAIRSTLFWIYWTSVTACLIPMVVIAMIAPKCYAYRLLRWWSPTTLYGLRFFCGVRFQIEGQENFTHGNGIVFCNHQSTWETMAMPMIAPEQTWVFKKQLLKIPVFGQGVQLLNPIVIDRSAGHAAVNQIIDQGTKILQGGRWIVLFPEGTRMPAGTVGKFKIGGAILAEKSHFPVIPIAHNAGHCWPRMKFIKRPGLVRVHIGKPIITKGKSADEINQEARDWIVSQVKSFT